MGSGGKTGTPQFWSRGRILPVFVIRLRGRALGYYYLRDVLSMMEKGGKAGETGWDWLQEDRAPERPSLFLLFHYS